MTAETMQPQLQEQAAQWVETLHDGVPCDAVMTAFDEWMNQSPAHADAYFSLSEQYYELDFINAGDISELLDLATPPTTTTDENKVVNLASRRSLAARLSSVTKPFSIAACLAACFVLSQVYLFGEKADLMSPVGEVALHQLSDQSSVYLNTNTLLNVSIDESGRNLELVRGEAYFTVAKDPLRPFTVHTEGAEIRALGTEFVVHNRDAGKTRVSVYESSVEVFHPVYMPERKVIATGETIEFGPNVAQPMIAKLNKNDAAAWREGRLMFNNTPLAEVIAELNEYHNGKILMDSSLDNVRISGVFHKIDSVRILNDIVETQNLSSMHVANRVIYVYR